MKVLIADDESIVLYGLQHIIDWNSLGFFICATAKNGNEALNLILIEKPQLVLLDIKMPKLNGIDVVKMAREQGYTGNFILLSGISDFHYAQIAMQYNVDFYLTKPIEESELINAVTKVRSMITEEQTQQHSLMHYRKKAKIEILKDLLQGKPLVSTINLDDLGFSTSIYQVIIFENYYQNYLHITWNFSDLFKSSVPSHNCIESVSLDNKNVIILNGEAALQQFQSILHHYDNTPEKGSPLDSLFLTYGRAVTDISQLSISYEDACKLANRRFFCSQQQHIIGYQSLPFDINADYTLSQDESTLYHQTLFDCILTYNRIKLSNTMITLHDNLFHCNSDVSTIKYFLTDLYIQVMQSIKNAFTTVNIPFLSNAYVLDFIDKKFYLYEILQFLSEQFEVWMNAIGYNSSDGILKEVLHYIDHNYQENLKLDTISQLFGYNSCYLGKLFSKSTGENFKTYLDRIRIEHAKELLVQTSQKVYTIGQQVGYSNVDYFHKKFKKYAGCSPAEYRKEKGI